MANPKNMKKRIFIEAHYLEIGGAEISLIGLLNAINYSRFDVDLFLYAHRGELLSLIPKEVNLLPEIPAYAQMENPLIHVFRKGFFRQGFARIKAKIKYHFWANKNKPDTPEAYFQYLDNEIMPTLPSLYNLGIYDLAINFIALKNHIPSKVKAKKSLTWIHTDLTSISVNPALELPAWDRYDNIISISTQATASFVKVFPSLMHKVIEVENILSSAFVRKRAEAFDAQMEFNSYGGEIHLLSVGRFCYAKNYDNVPDICRRIVEAGIDVRWFIIGFGNDEELIRKKISENRMERHVILLGKRSNPYPYIKACDIYVQPSRYEGKSVTVREAQMLCRPVIVTNFTTASSQVQNGHDGIILPMDNALCADGIFALINNPNKRKALESACQETNYGNELEVEKIYKLAD